MSENETKKVKKTADMKKYMKEYHKKYYPLNKHRYVKKKVAVKNKKAVIAPVKKYSLTICKDNGDELITIKYKSQKEISKALNVPEHTINRIYLKKYSYDKKCDTNSKLKHYTINKL